MNVKQVTYHNQSMGKLLQENELFYYDENRLVTKADILKQIYNNETIEDIIKNREHYKNAYNRVLNTIESTLIENGYNVSDKDEKLLTMGLNQINIINPKEHYLHIKYSKRFEKAKHIKIGGYILIAESEFKKYRGGL